MIIEIKGQLINLERVHKIYVAKATNKDEVSYGVSFYMGDLTNLYIECGTKEEAGELLKSISLRIEAVKI